MVASRKRKEEEEESKQPRSRERVAWVSRPSFVGYTLIFLAAILFTPYMHSDRQRCYVFRRQPVKLFLVTCLFFLLVFK